MYYGEVFIERLKNVGIEWKVDDLVVMEGTRHLYVFLLSLKFMR